MNKTEVYSWRITPQIKRSLEREARREGTSVSVLLERIAKEWIVLRQNSDDDEESQRRLRDSATKTIGSISGKSPGRSVQARASVRKRLSLRHGR